MPKVSPRRISGRSVPGFGRVIGFSSFAAAAEATTVTGRLTGGIGFLPVVVPTNITDCDGSGNTGGVTWPLSQPGTPPVGQEFVVPLSKTGPSQFQILDLDPTLSCGQEMATPPSLQWDTFPVDVPSDPGNNCAKPISDYLHANLIGHVVLIPVCDVNCSSGVGNNSVYHIIKVAAFYIADMPDSKTRTLGVPRQSAGDPDDRRKWQQQLSHRMVREVRHERACQHRPHWTFGRSRVAARQITRSATPAGQVRNARFVSRGRVLLIGPRSPPGVTGGLCGRAPFQATV